MSLFHPDVNHLVQFSFVDRKAPVVYQIDEITAKATKDYLNDFEEKTWPFYWFQTVHGVDVAVNQDGIELVHVFFEIDETDLDHRNSEDDFDVAIHFKGLPAIPYECDVASPTELTRFLLALSKRSGEDGPFASFLDSNGHLVLFDARKILYVEATSEVVQKGWTEVLAEDLQKAQTDAETGQPDQKLPRKKRASRTRRTKMPEKS